MRISMAEEALLDIFIGEITDIAQIKNICYAAATTLRHLIKIQADLRVELDRKIACMENMNTICEIAGTCDNCPFSSAENCEPIIKALKK